VLLLRLQTKSRKDSFSSSNKTGLIKSNSKLRRCTAVQRRAICRRRATVKSLVPPGHVPQRPGRCPSRRPGTRSLSRRAGSPRRDRRPADALPCRSILRALPPHHLCHQRARDDGSLFPRGAYLFFVSTTACRLSVFSRPYGTINSVS